MWIAVRARIVNVNCRLLYYTVDKNTVYLPFTLEHVSRLQSLTFGETSYHVDFIADTLMTLNSNTRLASLLLHIGIVDTFIDWPNLKFPTVMRVDYVRWYQKKGEEMVTCDPPGFETTKYIKDHINAYTNPNFTVSSKDGVDKLFADKSQKWDETGHKWPRHELNSDCKARTS